MTATMTTIDITKYDSYDIGVKILGFAKSKEETNGTLKAYFWGTQHFDTAFDKSSGKLETGVIAKNEDAGKAMLVVLKYFVDDDEDLVGDLEYKIEENDGEINPECISVETIVKLLSSISDGYRSSFDLNETYTTKTYGYKNGNHITNKIEKKFHEVKFYNLALLSDQ